MCKYCIALQNPSGSRALGEKGKFWPVGETLGIQFIGGTEEQKSLVQYHAQTWTYYANIDFKWDVDKGEIRVAFNDGDGAWSYIGTDCKSIPLSRPTMNLGWLDQSVILHEFGHALGLGHEHQNPEGGIQWNVDQVIKDLSGAPNYWDISTIMFNVIEPYRADQIVGTKLDPFSIMMYAFPKEWTLNGFETDWNEELSDQDKDFIGSVYPFEQEPADDVLEAFRTVFQGKSDLKKLNEGVICRIGDLIGAGTDEHRYWKRENLEKVWQKLIG